MGIHVSDLMIVGDDIYGEGMNLASRLEAAAEPGGICLSAAVVDQVNGRVSAQFRDLGQLAFKNIAAPVRAFAVVGLGDALASGIKPPRPQEPDRSTIAVLNFQNQGGDDETALFAQGITEDLITDLSRFREFFVIAHRSSKIFETEKTAPEEIAASLKVRYLVDGSVRKNADRLRLTVRVVDALTMGSVWSERFDRQAGDLFALQDEIVEAIVRTLVRKISSADAQRLRNVRPESLREYELLLKARSIIAVSKASNEQARAFYQAAIEQNPDYALAWEGLSSTYLIDWTSGWAEDPDAALAKSKEAARKALQLDPACSETHHRMGLAALMSRDYASAERHLKRSVELNPNAATGWIYIGLLAIYDGRPDDALENVEKAMRHNPFHDSFYYWFQGLALYSARRYEDAIEPLRQAVQQQDQFIAPHRHMAACFGMLGWEEQAKGEKEAILALDPEFTISKLVPTLAYRSKPALEHYLEGLRRAGLPE